MAKIDGLGEEGEVVQVADGYARNFLFPKNLAAPVTEATRRRIEKLKKDRVARLEREKVEAVELAKRIEKVSCTIPVKTAAEDKMYGSVTPADIAAILKEQGVDVDRHKIELEKPIRELGVFKVNIKLHPEVEAPLKVWVVEE
jgi:large subunit ribosomal protein L9